METLNKDNAIQLSAKILERFASSPASSITLQHIANWNAKLTQEDLNTFADSYYTKTQVNSLVTGIEQYEPVRVSALPTASADTMHKMYFAPTGTGGTYEVYITVTNGESYEHVKVNLSDTYTKAEIDTLVSIFSKTQVVTKTALDISATIDANKLYLWTEPISTLAIAFASETAGIVNEYMIQFTCPSNAATTLTLPNTVRWVNDNPIEPEAGFTYQISVINNLAVFAGWEAASNE